MKIFILSDYPQAPSGLSILGCTFYRALTALGHECCIESFWINNIQEMIKHFNPDIVLSIGFWGFAPQLIDIPQKLGYKVVPFFVPNGKIPIYMDIIQKTKCMIVPAQLTKDIYARDGYPADQIRIVHLGTDPMLFNPNAHWAKYDYARSLLSKSKELLLFGFWSGNVHKEPDGNISDDWRMVYALPEIQKSVDNFFLMLKIYANSAHLNELFSVATELGVRDKLKTIDVMFPYEAMPNLYNAFMDIHVSVPALSGFEIHRIEAMSCGKPSIGGAWSPDNEIIADKETGYLVKAEVTTNRHEIGAQHMPYRGLKYTLSPVNYASIPDFADKVIRLLKDEKERKRMGNAARERVISHFNIIDKAKELAGILEECQ